MLLLRRAAFPSSTFIMLQPHGDVMCASSRNVVTDGRKERPPARGFSARNLDLEAIANSDETAN